MNMDERQQNIINLSLLVKYTRDKDYNKIQQIINKMDFEHPMEESIMKQMVDSNIDFKLVRDMILNRVTALTSNNDKALYTAYSFYFKCLVLSDKYDELKECESVVLNIQDENMRRSLQYILLEQAYYKQNVEAIVRLSAIFE